jgi:hypothetical protein
MAAPSDILVGKADTLDLPSTQNSSDEWMKSFALERHFLLTLCCCWQKVSRTARKLCEKSHAWQCPLGHNDLKHALKGTSSLKDMTWDPFQASHFFLLAQNKVTKKKCALTTAQKNL